MAITLTPPKSALYDPRIVLVSVALAVFLGLAAMAVASETTPGDVWLTRQVQAVDVPAIARALDTTEDAAQFPVYLISIAVAAGIFLTWGGRRPAMMMLAVPLVAWVTPLLKTLIGRPRPDAALVEVVLPQSGSMSFPSGHAFSAVVAYGLIFCLATAYIPVRWLRIGVQSACVWIIVLTCIERVYVGRHWPSDVAGGMILGALVVFLFVAIERRARARADSNASALVSPSPRS